MLVVKIITSYFDSLFLDRFKDQEALQARMVNQGFLDVMDNQELREKLD